MSERSEAAEPETGTAEARPFGSPRVSRRRREGVARGPFSRRRDSGRANLLLGSALALLASAALSASEIARTFRIRIGDESVRVVVPKKYEPLRPGSVYPNRRKPVPALGCPVAVVERVAPLTASVEPFLLERGFVVVEMASIDPRRIDDLLHELSRHAEADAAAASLLVWRASAAAGSPRIAAVAIFDPASSPAGGGNGSRCVPTALFLRTPGRSPGEGIASGEPSGPECAIEKWYRGEKGFPPEAFRDAAEWLAELR